MFCRNCGHRLEDDDKVCAVCGERVDTPQTVPTKEKKPDKGTVSEAEDKVDTVEKAMDKQDEGFNLSVDEDIKTPLFNFKWNIQDFPKEEPEITEDIDFAWSKPENSSVPDSKMEKHAERSLPSDDSIASNGLNKKHAESDSAKQEYKSPERKIPREPLVEQMKHAVDPEEIDKATPFSDEIQREEPITDEWYEPFSMKKSDDRDTMFKFNKKNEEFQELLDREYEKYNRIKRESAVDVNTRKYSIDDFIAADKEAKAEAEIESEDMSAPNPEKPAEPKIPEPEAAESTTFKPEISESEISEPEPTVAEEHAKPESTIAEESEKPEPTVVEEPTKPEPTMAEESAKSEPTINEESITPKPVKTEEPAKSEITGMGLFAEDIISPFQAGEKADGIEPAESDSPEDSQSLHADTEPVIESHHPDMGMDQTQSMQAQDKPTQEQHPLQTEHNSTATPQQPISNSGGIPAFIDTSVVSPFDVSPVDQNNTYPTSIDNDEFLKDLPSGPIEQPTIPQTDGQPIQQPDNTTTGTPESDGSSQSEEPSRPEGSEAEESPRIPEELKPDPTTPAPFETQDKIVGPEIVNEPVVFPFELDDKTGPQPVAAEQSEETQTQAQTSATSGTPAEENLNGTQANEKPNINQGDQIKSGMPQQEANHSDQAESASRINEAPLNPSTSSPVEPKPEGTVFIKVLVAIIIIILIMLASIGIMKFAPQSAMGIILNNVFETVLSAGNGTAEDDGEAAQIAPSDDLDAVIKSQLSENRNIKQIIFDASVGYDDTVSYKINGANNSVPIENNLWKNDAGEMLFDEQAVRTIIGYNSTWVGFINDGYDDIFNYVVKGSAAEDSLKDESIDKNSYVEYTKLGIGEIRQNGNKFYVWTNEFITINDGNGNKEDLNLRQLYELETADDSLKITTVIKL